MSRKKTSKIKYNPEMPSETYDISDLRALQDSQIMEHMAGTPGMRFDDADDASVFFARELDHIKTRTYDRLYPELTALKLFPVSSEVNPGAETITYYGYEKIGFAKIIQNYATDLPRTDVKGKPETAHIKSIGASYGYSVQEMRASRYAGKSLDVRKGESARYASDKEINRIAWVGDEEAGLMGVLSSWNNVPLYTPALNSGGTSTQFKDKTPDEILKDFSGAIAFMAQITMDVERPNTIAVASDAYIYLSTTPRSTHSDKTILSWLLDNLPDIEDIVRCPELNANSGINPYGSQAVMLLYNKSDEKLTIENPLLFYQYPVQPVNLEMVIPCEARTAGTIIYYPLSMLIVPGV